MNICSQVKAKELRELFKSCSQLFKKTPNVGTELKSSSSDESNEVNSLEFQIKISYFHKLLKKLLRV